MRRIFYDLRQAAWSAFDHSIFSMAKATAYSALLSIFPAFLLLTTFVAFTSSEDSIAGVIGTDLEHVLPADTIDLVRAYCQTNRVRSVHLVWAATVVSLSGAIGVMFSLMEGFRRAYQLPRGVWGIWREPVVALLLVPGTLIPEAFATLFLVFGHSLEQWMIQNSDQDLHSYVLFLWRIFRWTTGLLTSVIVLAIIYRCGVPREMHTLSLGRRHSLHFSAWARTNEKRVPTGIPRRWGTVLAGALLATGTWFIATMLYGLYLSRFSDRSLVYGPLSAAVVTLVWLYLVSFSILIGAEFNAQLFPAQGHLVAGMPCNHIG